jgi:ABC-2 type transport system ATP-binding protein
VNGTVFPSNLTKFFRTTAVLDGVSLEVPEGSVFGLVGPDDSRKTTTIKIPDEYPAADRRARRGARCGFAPIGPDGIRRSRYVSKNQEMPEWLTVEEFMAYLKPFNLSWMTSTRLI